MSDYGVVRWTAGKGTSCDTQKEAEQIARDESKEHGGAYAFTVEVGNYTETIAIYINGVRYAVDKQPE